MAPKLLTEFIGTFFLVLTIGLTVLIGTEFAPIAIGAVLMVMVYMGGPVSGAHYNPAVTLAVWMRGALPAREIAPYMITQVAAALVAAAAVYFINDRPLVVAPGPETTLVEFFLLELLFTFALVLVILNVATVDETAGNHYYGLAIGFTVLAGAFAAGPISGGAFNPAVALGPILLETIIGDGRTLGDLWIYLVACFGGGVLGALAFRLQHPTPTSERIAA
ncbi:MAG: aquaporin [Rubricoccaceae bacterium]|nr:aquaporin [Rubricoccaceae bacterium]